MIRREGALLLLALLAGLPACDLEEAEESSVSELRLEATGSRPSISVRLERGSVEIVGSETNRVRAVVKKRARSLDRDVARSLLERIDVESEQTGDRIQFVDRTRFPGTHSLGMELRADLELQVPMEVDLDVRTGDGRIRIEGVRGNLLADTADGRVVLERTEGSARLRSADGSLVARNVKGDLDAQTEDGSIEISGAPGRLRAVTADGRIEVDCDPGTTLSGEWVLHTADGSIELSLPPSVSADLDATASSGRIDNGLSSFQGSERNRRLAGRIGEGGALILISTMDGRIELRNSSR